MPTTALPIIVPKTTRGGTIAANGADIVLTACDVANGNNFLCSGRDIVLVQNTGAGARTITFTSENDNNGRPGNISAYSLAAGEFALFGPFFSEGWAQRGATDTGKVLVTGEHAEVKVGVIKCEF
jgi:hypothetical protein